MKKMITLLTLAACVALAGPSAMAKSGLRKGRPATVHQQVKSEKKKKTAKLGRRARHSAKRGKKSAPAQNEKIS